MVASTRFRPFCTSCYHFIKSNGMSKTKIKIAGYFEHHLALRQEDIAYEVVSCDKGAGGCDKYRTDITFCFGLTLVHLEIDESGHADRELSCEAARMCAIGERSDMRTVFLRVSSEVLEDETTIEDRVAAVVTFLNGPDWEPCVSVLPPQTTGVIYMFYTPRSQPHIDYTRESGGLMVLANLYFDQTKKVAEPDRLRELELQRNRTITSVAKRRKKTPAAVTFATLAAPTTLDAPTTLAAPATLATLANADESDDW
jgi:hypothetical protein